MQIVVKIQSRVNKYYSNLSILKTSSNTRSNKIKQKLEQNNKKIYTPQHKITNKHPITLEIKIKAI